jgi:DNA-binding GntR family transcriptional regulator
MWNSNEIKFGEKPSSIMNVPLSDQVYEVLQDWIFTRKLPMGQRLDFGELERKLGVSRTPLNEAIRLLESDGLIENIPRKGKYVTTLHQKDVLEHFEIRQILELGVAEDIIKEVTSEEFSIIENICNQMAVNHAYNEHSLEYIHFIKLDAAFHRQILAIARNELLLNIYNSLLLHLRLASIFYSLREKRIKKSILEHKDIVAALKKRDVDLLIQATTIHLTNSKEAILDRMQVLE